MRSALARPSTRAEFKQALTELIAFGLSSRRRRPLQTDVDGTTPLFDSGLIDSLAILELIAFVEEATGRSIPARQVQMKHFGTIDRICAAFWPDEREVHDGSR
jgi:acyl carrier protein